MDDKIAGILVILTFIAVVAILLYGSLMGIGNATVDSQCLKRGWREGRIDYTLTKYCVNRNDQTDTVKPLKEIPKP